MVTPAILHPQGTVEGIPKDTETNARSGLNGSNSLLEQQHLDASSQMELVGQSIMLTSYPYADPQHRGILIYGASVFGELSATSPGHLSMASPSPGGGGKRRIVDPVRKFGFPVIGNVAWKERVDGWKMKQEKPVIPMTKSHPP